MMRCVGCRFYDRNERLSADGGDLRWGRCRRSVPALHPVDGRTFSAEGVWPRVRDDDWCGAWEARGAHAEPAALPADSLLASAGQRGDPAMPAAAAAGPRESLMVPPEIARTSPAGANHFASD
ncbi:MAG TPA: hypothetical protein VFK60_01400 [Casimicrobiaceae bacterium]|nr:hypothetical protein [Casimicrobiaceae bacterium]